MAFSFSPEQAQQPQVSAAPVTNNGVPVLVVPTIPNIAVGGAALSEEKISPFAFRNRNKSKFGVYLQFVIFFVFGVLVFAAIFMYVYQQTLKSQINSKKKELDSLQSKFPDMPLEDMQKISNRLKIVNKVMQEHASSRVAFEILEKSVDDSIVYTKFSLIKNKNKKGYMLELIGESPSYVKLYQQNEALKDKLYSKYVFDNFLSSINLDKKGIVNFKLISTISLEGVHPIKTLSLNASSSSNINQTDRFNILDTSSSSVNVISQ